MLLDEVTISEYDIRPFELLELHRTSSYVVFPRTFLLSYACMWVL